MKRHLLTAAALCAMGISASALPTGASAPTLLIQHECGLMAPVWSPDGSQIAVTTDNYTGILVAKADGTGLRQVTSAPGAGYRMEWSTDCSSIRAKEASYDGVKIRRQAKLWNVATGQSSELASGATSPRNVSTPLGAGNVYSIMVDDAAGATSRIASLRGNDNLMVINPALSPDGTKIAFQIVSKGVWVCDADGSNAKQLCAGSHPAWLPDGHSVIVTRVQDDGARFTASDIYAVDTIDGSEVLLTGSSNLIPLTPTVTTDGRKVAFENAIDASIYVINLNY